MTFDKNDYTLNNKLLHELFEEQAVRTPDHIALCFEGETLTYDELNNRANHVAQVLRENGVQAGVIVAIMLNRSFEMIIGLLSILKAGGAYVPIDPEYPQDRIDYILEDSGASFLLSSRTYKDGSLKQKDCMIFLEDCNMDGYSPNQVLGTTVHDLAYIVYTSGSTGKPKGVMIEHRSIVNTICWRRDYYCFDETDAVLQLPSISFDSSVEDIFTALSSGAKLVLIKQVGRLNVKYLEKIIQENQVTHFLTVPSFYKVLLEDAFESFRSIRTITIAGESFTPHLIQAHFSKVPFIKLFNEYGPTENSVCSTVYEFNRQCDKVLIGKPIPHVDCFVIDENQQAVPVGAEGELCVSGIGLARGYWNRNELTASKFVSNPFLPGMKMYKTGDLVKQLPDGNFQFIGRIDSQVKIRGHRVELGEVEFILEGYPAIDEAIVVPWDAPLGNKILCAYYVSNQELLSDEIISFISKSLPEYMIPQYFIKIDRIPLTPNGKTDRDALSKEVPVFLHNQYVEDPSNMESAIQNRIIRLLSEITSFKVPIESMVLDAKLKKIGVDSIGFITLMVKIENEFEIELDYDDLDQLIHPSLRDLITYIEMKVSDSSNVTYEAG